MSWEKLLEYSKAQRQELRGCVSTPFTKMYLVPTQNGGAKLYALGTPPVCSNQTVLVADLPSVYDISTPPVSQSQPFQATPYTNIQLRPLINPENLRSFTPSHEFSLMCERQRSTVVMGVTDYSLHQLTGQVLVITGELVYVYSDRELRKIQMEPDGKEEDSLADSIPQKADEMDPELQSANHHGGNFVSDAQICPSDSSIIAYVLNKEIYIEKSGQIIYSTKSGSASVYNGVPSFITLEELDRFEGIWWSPTETRLLYEQVNESGVQLASFVCPGKPPTAPMRYPAAGTKNAVSTLRMITINGKTIRDVGLRLPLKGYYAQFEYLVRCGFLPDGRNIWVQLMDRAQEQCALTVIPICEFEGEEPDDSMLFTKPLILYHQKSPIWINCHDAICPLSRSTPHTIQFIYGTEENSHFHLKHLTVACRRTVAEPASVLDITNGDFSVCKATGVRVDEERKLVYFVANKSHPTEWNVCVGSYSQQGPAFKRLTEQGLSFKGERSSHRLSVLPDRGFVCWMTSLTMPYQCRYYALSHTNGALPNAHFIMQIQIQGYVSPTHSLSMHDQPAIITYKSNYDKDVRYALLMRPTDWRQGLSYPVLHYVYAGPGIQLVRNDFSTWQPFKKYTRLGFVVLMCDGRGSSNRGLHFEAPLKRKFGEVEIEDQLEGLHAVAHAANGLLDLQRVVVQGWSYGGYMALLMLARHPRVYRAALAGGVVTDWHLYDTAYTERYLGYPLDDYYEDSSALRWVDNLPNEPGRLMLMHGLMDENVHFSNCEALIEILIKRGKPYELKLFPSERHGVKNGESAVYLDATMLNFIFNALNA
ncbi:hypothetical protein WR25_10015 [Diploscapter pachys]|uniref:Peptidase S9 prolyl oligopeptidase catalytic domain-containing protein n=1 Tax=Diploscapter pachys TaxID=2018661 RepID=A0A2A2L702_9BILA|nr:hypothetical protein WR25_10015 [Diploscapter pachys]